MQVLVGWDNPGEAEAIGLFLNVDDIEAKVATDPGRGMRTTRITQRSKCRC